MHAVRGLVCFAATVSVFPLHAETEVPGYAKLDSVEWYAYPGCKAEPVPIAEGLVLAASGQASFSHEMPAGNLRFDGTVAFRFPERIPLLLDSSNGVRVADAKPITIDATGQWEQTVTPPKGQTYRFAIGDHQSGPDPYWGCFSGIVDPPAAELLYTSASVGSIEKLWTGTTQFLRGEVSTFDCRSSPGSMPLTISVQFEPGGVVILSPNYSCVFPEEPPPGTRRPVLIVPGIAGTYAADMEHDLNWLRRRGVPPSSLQIDPLKHTYDDLIQSLRSAGYVDGKTLFIANYDWRMPPGPIDGKLDGRITGLTPASLTDSTYEYGVDYLAHFLKLAQEAWRASHPDLPPLASVDTVTHSTGGLVVRTYIQSDAYGGAYTTDSGPEALPRIHNLIMVAVPNQGASKIWNPMHDNWISDQAYKYVLSKIVNRAYKRVLLGDQITAPSADDVIHLGSIVGGNGVPDPVRFIRRYVPTMRCLLATYDFIDFGRGLTNVNDLPDLANKLILDLNADHCAIRDMCRVSVIFSGSSSTPVSVVQHTGPVGPTSLDVIAPMSAYSDRNAAVGEVWYSDESVRNGGDGTVPVISSYDLFKEDSAITCHRITEGDTSHLGLMSNLVVQRSIFQILGFDPDTLALSTGLFKSEVSQALWLGSDPVDLLFVDRSGRRLGYTEETGVLTELDDSVWLGQADGLGLVFGPLELPGWVRLIGRGEDYLVHVAVTQDAGSAEFEWSGHLPAGETLEYEIRLPPAAADVEITSIEGPAEGQLQIRFQADLAGALARLEMAARPQGEWSTVAGAVLTDVPEGHEFLCDMAGAPAQAFYRVVVEESGESGNLLGNPGAEQGAGSRTGSEVLPIPGWSTASGFTAALYGGHDLLTEAESERIGGGATFFYGGPSNSSSSARQLLDVAGEAVAIDSGQRWALLSARIGVLDASGDEAQVRAEFLDQGSGVLGELRLGPLHGTAGQLQTESGSALIPAHTRQIRVLLESTRRQGSSNDGCFDNIALSLGSASAAMR